MGRRRPVAERIAWTGCACTTSAAAFSRSSCPRDSGTKNVIDGTTQSGASVGNLWAGTPHTLKVELNGTVILDTDLSAVKEFMANSPHPGKDRTSGFFGLAGHNDPVEFRNLAIKPLN